MKMSQLKDSNLHGLLEGILCAHRQDIHAYSGGHLNEANLYKVPKQQAFKATWKSSTKPITPMVQKSQLPKSRREKMKEEKMKTTIVDFSLGTARTSKTPKGLGPLKSPVSDQTSLSEKEHSVAEESDHSLYSKMDDRVLIEEIKLADTMLTRSDNYKQKAWAREDFRHQGARYKPVSQGQIKDENLVKLSKHQFLPSHLEGVTKKDQFNKLKNFESSVLRKQDTMEQNVLTGVKAVDHLETKLKQDLDNLPYDGYGPNFHRLQLYSNTFDDLITDSPTFGFILKTIKKEYDSYVSSLLDSQRDKHKILYKQVEKLASHGTSNPEVLGHEVTKVHALQSEARAKLQENERLRQEVQQEVDLAAQPEPEIQTPRKMMSYRDEPELEIAEQVEQLHTSILEKLDAMKELKGKLRTEYVPSSVVQHLEQCIKETEVEIQKLTSSKEYFERSIAEMEKDLQDAIENADTTERDARRVWKKVSAVKSLDKSRGQHGSVGVQGRSKTQMDDSDSEDDASKWSWYIS